MIASPETSGITTATEFLKPKRVNRVRYLSTAFKLIIEKRPHNIYCTSDASRESLEAILKREKEDNKTIILTNITGTPRKQSRHTSPPTQYVATIGEQNGIIETKISAQCTKEELARIIKRSGPTVYTERQLQPENLKQLVAKNSFS